jgi:hypothetical protein
MFLAAVFASGTEPVGLTPTEIMTASMQLADIESQAAVAVVDNVAAAVAADMELVVEVAARKELEVMVVMDNVLVEMVVFVLESSDQWDT